EPVDPGAWAAGALDVPLASLGALAISTATRVPAVPPPRSSETVPLTTSLPCDRAACASMRRVRPSCYPGQLHDCAGLGDADARVAKVPSSASGAGVAGGARDVPSHGGSDASRGPRGVSLRAPQVSTRFG